MEKNDLSRFYSSHKMCYQNALSEIRNGKKKSHWMWFIFPQLSGLGHSAASVYYGISGLEEAESFLHDEYLGAKLCEISQALLELETNSPDKVFGVTDAKKLKSSMTLFSLVGGAPDVFQEVLEKFYDGKRDSKTLSMLGFSGKFKYGRYEITP